MTQLKVFRITAQDAEEIAPVISAALHAALARRALAITAEEAKSGNAEILQELINAAAAIVGDD